MVAFGITPDRAWQATTDELVTATHSIGFERLGVIADRVDAGAVAAFDAASLGCHEVLAVVVSDDRDATIAKAEAVAAAAEQMGAEWVLTTFAVGIDGDARRTVEQCSAIYADANVAAEYT